MAESVTRATSASPPRIGGIVLCGGEGCRMGRSKALLRFGDERLLQRVVRIVSSVVTPVVVAARRDTELPPLGREILRAFDRAATAGPLAGLAGGFEVLRGRCDAAFVAACDHPFLTPAFIKRLIDLLGDASAVVPQVEGRCFPTTAVYRIDTGALLDEMLASGDFRAFEFARRCQARRVTPRDFFDADSALDSLCNINTPEEYAAALSRLGLPPEVN